MAAAGANAGGNRPPWRAYLDEVFPGYLLPASMRNAIDPQTAARFLERLGNAPGDLDLLLRSSLMAGRAGELEPFCRQLADLTSKLPSETRSEKRQSEGHVHGRVAVRETMAHRLGGSPTRFVASERKRAFDLPENELVRYVAERLRGLIESLRKKDLLREKHWGGPALACEAELHRLVHRTELRRIEAPAVITAHHEQAARAARHPCYESALDWHLWMKDALDERDDRRLAQILAEGALQPSPPDKQFEIAVAVRLVEAIEQHCDTQQPGAWRFERSIVQSGQRDIARFHRDEDGACIQVFYDVPVLPPDKRRGPRDRGVLHYFDGRGRFRPDITVLVERPPDPTLGVVLEVKLSDKKDYVVSGYEEALLYRYEYADDLLAWPKAVLVSSSDIHGAVSRDHEVVAVDWRRWVPPALIEAVVPPGSPGPAGPRA